MDAPLVTRAEEVVPAEDLSPRLLGSAPPNMPLAVDLDGTLLRTDALLESLTRLLATNPLSLFLLPVWLRKGRAHFKRQIALRVRLDPAALPYQPEVLDYLRDEAKNGRRLILATSSDQLIADAIAAHLGIFSDVLASDGERNLRGSEKAAALTSLLADQAFAYAGNEEADLPVWRTADRAVVVSHSKRLASAVTSVAPIERLFQPASSMRLSALLRALRPNHWVKNVLVLVPLVAAHRVSDIGLLVEAVLAFLAFGLVASAGYLVNDLMDVEADRSHPGKRNRPFASGDLDFRLGLVAAPLLLLAGIVLGALVSWRVGLVLLGYFAAAQSYTFYLKKIPVADVFTLAVLYAARVFVGSVATDVPISQWLLAFSVFFFLCLAFVKRFSELYGLRMQQQQQPRGRGYLVVDFEMLSSLGAASGYISVLVLALYINSPEVTTLYRMPGILWLVCLVLLYWISRIWMIANRGYIDDDPILFALRDRTSYLAGGLCAAAVVAAWTI